MNANLVLSIIIGAWFAIAAFLIFLFIDPESAFLYALLTGAFSTLLMHICLLVYGKKNGNRYATAENKISSPVIYKANGNFHHENQIRNGNVYFCEKSIVIISLDKKPHLFKEIRLSDVDKYAFDTVHMNISTKEGFVFSITLSDADLIAAELKSRNYFNSQKENDD